MLSRMKKAVRKGLQQGITAPATASTSNIELKPLASISGNAPAASSATTATTTGVGVQLNPLKKLKKSSIDHLLKQVPPPNRG